MRTRRYVLHVRGSPAQSDYVSGIPSPLKSICGPGLDERCKHEIQEESRGELMPLRAPSCCVRAVQESGDFCEKRPGVGFRSAWSKDWLGKMPVSRGREKRAELIPVATSEEALPFIALTRDSFKFA